jgi:hypothetical protein
VNVNDCEKRKSTTAAAVCRKLKKVNTTSEQNKQLGYTCAFYVEIKRLENKKSAQLEEVCSMLIRTPHNFHNNSRSMYVV